MNRKKKRELRKTIQRDVLTFDGITMDGILLGKGYCSKLYALADSNFVVEPEEKQLDILANYVSFINSFPDNVYISVVIINKRNTMENLSKSFHLQETNTKQNYLTKAYNDIIDVKIEDGNNDIQKNKYILVTVQTKTLSDAKLTFSTVELSLQEKTKAINRVGVTQIDALNRLRIMKEISSGCDGLPFEKAYQKYFDATINTDGKPEVTFNFKKLKRAGVSVKDIVAPEGFARVGNTLTLGEDRVCRSYSCIDFPSVLDTSFLTNITNLPYEMVTVIQLRSVPRKTAIRNVKVMNVSIKADKIKAEQQAYRSGYDPASISEDLLTMADEARELRHDIVEEGKKLFYVTMTTTLFAKNEKELATITNLYRDKCTDFSIAPNPLYAQQISAFRMALLFGTSEIVVDRMITGDNARALFPFYVQELMDKRGHFYGINAISKNMIMYDRKRSKLANGLIFGRAGSGKSFLGKGEIIANLLDGDDEVIILDPENEYRAIGEKFDGAQMDFATIADFHFNPCDMSMEWDDAKVNPLAEKCDFMVSLVESIRGNGRVCNSFDVSAIHRATNKIYEDYIAEMTRRHQNGDNRNIDTTICPTLVDFYNELLNDRTIEAQKLAQELEPYCIGAYNLFAHRTNVDTHSRLTIMNLRDLPTRMTEMAMKVCLSNIWTRIVDNLERNRQQGTNKAIYVYLDEFHLFFNTESSIATICSYFKRVRKYGGIMTGITQDVVDLQKTTQGMGIFGNTGFFVFMEQSPNSRMLLQQLYGWSDSQLDYLNDKGTGVGLIYNLSELIPFNYSIPTDNPLYTLLSTNPNDVEIKKFR